MLVAADFGVSIAGEMLFFLFSLRFLFSSFRFCFWEFLEVEAHSIFGLLAVAAGSLAQHSIVAGLATVVLQLIGILVSILSTCSKLSLDFTSFFESTICFVPKTVFLKNFESKKKNNIKK